MHWIVALAPTAIIILSAIGTIVDAIRKSKKGPGPSTMSATPRPQRPSAPRGAAPIATGYAGRRAQAALPDHARAIDSAGTRLSSGAEYPSIVAERQADRDAEERFRKQIGQLESSEPTRAMSLPYDENARPQRRGLSDFENRLSEVAGENGRLLTAVILAEILGPPRCKHPQIRSHINIGI
jgi:hypothetical protein